MWQLVEYSKKYKANFASYVLHYRAAVRPKPNSISMQRMEWLVERGVIMRMKGEIPNGERDTRRVKGTEADVDSPYGYGRGYRVRYS